MPDILFIDGYNIIHAWPELRSIADRVDLSAARDKLIDMACDYAGLTAFEVILVFDARQKNTESADWRGNVKVVYTGRDETADHYIERSVDELDCVRHNVYVATSDNIEQILVLGRGASRISARELRRMFLEQHASRSRHYAGGSRFILEHRLGEDVRRELESLRRSWEEDEDL